MEFVDAFKPIYFCSKSVQAMNCGLSEFFYQWTKAIIALNQLQNNRFQMPILQSMEKREGALTKSNAFKAAVYFDPRFTYPGSKYFSANEKEAVVVSLILK